MATITVLGAGMMGSAWCVPLVDRGHDVRLVGTPLDGDIVSSLKATRVHPKLDLELPRGITPFSIDELGQAMSGVDVIGLGVSSAGIRWATGAIAPFVRKDTPVAMITKGLEWREEQLGVFPDLVQAGLPPDLRDQVFPAAVAGPCIAGELARRVPTGVVLTGRDGSTLERLADLFHTEYYYPFTSTDVMGTEVCAALKNAFAMGIAFALGLHAKSGGEPGSVAMHNHESAVFAQSIVEMQRVIGILGGDPASAAALAGVGDLDVTTNGGRTGRFGRWLGMGLSLSEAIDKMEGATLECLEILAVVEKALPVFETRGELASHELPLLRHLIAVALHGAPVAVPFQRFFSALGRPTSWPTP